MKQVGVLCLIISLALSSTFVMLDSMPIEAKEIADTSPLYTSRSPIRITSNADFNAGNGVTGGDGSAGNPWIIEGYEIDGGGNGNCIYFGETTDYFIVRNCRFYNANGNSGLYHWNTGVVLYKVQNGMISNNVIESNLEEGVYLWYSNNNAISNNTIHSNNGEGVDLWDSNNNKIYSNTIYSNNGVGIYIYTCIGSQISFNTVYLNLGKGIRFLDSNSNTVSKNTLERNADGMVISSSSNNIISNNSVSQNTGSGIYLSSSGGNTVNNNSIELHNERGLYIMSSNSNIFYGNYLSLNKYGAYMSSSSSLNTLYHNNFIDNTYRQAYDQYTNQWDNGYPSGGNYWSDYLRFDNYSGPNQDQPGSDGIGDTPYSIYGGSNVDNYPLMFPTNFVDDVSPASSVNAVAPYWHNSGPLEVISTATDNVGVADVSLWYRYSPDNTTWNTWTNFGLDASEPWSWAFNFPNGEGHYEFYSIANDTAGNTETMKSNAEARCAYDDRNPDAVTGPNQSVDQGTTVTFNGAGSTDNYVIESYTWTFTHNSTPITLHGVSPTFRFWTTGNYTVTLTVKDAAGNSETDTVIVAVNVLPGPGEDTEPGDEDDTDDETDTDTTDSDTAERGGIVDYWWAFILIGIIAILVVIIIKRKPGMP